MTAGIPRCITIHSTDALRAIEQGLFDWIGTGADRRPIYLGCYVYVDDGVEPIDPSEFFAAINRRVETAMRSPRTLVDLLRAHGEWAERSFGTTVDKPLRAEGIVKHIEKELGEIRKDPTDVVEWVDVAFLAFDGARRMGGSVEAVVEAFERKLAILLGRTVFTNTAEGAPCEHVRAGRGLPEGEAAEAA